MYENYISCLDTEAVTMIQMTETAIIPACAKDLKLRQTNYVQSMTFSIPIKDL